MDEFEFVPNPAQDDTYPYVLVLRERTPRQAPDGKWLRVYSFADGSVGEVISEDGNYDNWEKTETGQNFSREHFSHWRPAPSIEPDESEKNK